jgi:hypothetical protein
MRNRIHSFGLPVAGLMVALAGCDLSVSNPGPVQDEFLNDPGAHPAVVAGVRLAFTEGLNMVSFFGAEAAKEYTQGGRIHPIKLPVKPGQLAFEDIPDAPWNNAHRARWVAEDAVRRLEESLGGDAAKSPLVAEALLYAGYANRLLGENMCEAVLEAGAPQKHTAHFTRAEEQFTRAMAVAAAAGKPDLATAAQAGRASVRLHLGKNAEAAADAAAIPLGFRFQHRFGTSSTNHYNWIWYISSNTPYRAHSVVGTFFEQYFVETGDPRTPWKSDPAVPNAEFAWVKWLPQTKYADRTAPVTLSSGREMVLIRAEAVLRQGDWRAALELVNSLRAGLKNVRTGEPLPLWTASSEAEAWTALKRERGIELWLEARRLGDLRRWVEAKTPGEMEDVSDRIRLCIPIANRERQTNPNVGLDHADPINPLFRGS